MLFFPFLFFFHWHFPMSCTNHLGINSTIKLGLTFILGLLLFVCTTQYQMLNSLAAFWKMPRLFSNRIQTINLMSILRIKKTLTINWIRIIFFVVPTNRPILEQYVWSDPRKKKKQRVPHKNRYKRQS